MSPFFSFSLRFKTIFLIQLCYLCTRGFAQTANRIVLPAIDTTLTFQVAPASQSPDQPLSVLQAKTVKRSDSRRFGLGYDRSTYRQKNNDFCFDLYVFEQGAQLGQRWEVCEIPHGIFNDQLRDIEFEIPGTPDEKPKLIEVPLYSNGGHNVEGKAVTQRLDIGTANDLSFKITSTSGLSPVILPGSFQTSSGLPSHCFSFTPAWPDNGRLGVGESTYVRFRISPTIQCAFDAERTSGSDSADVTIAFVSKSGEFGYPKSESFTMPLKVRIYWPYLLITMALGLITGFTIRRILPPPSIPNDPLPFATEWKKDLLICLISAFLVEVAALFLFAQSGTSLKILSFELDPWHLSGTFLLAVVVSGGPRLASRYLGILK